jgi:hypothetical protein
MNILFHKANKVKLINLDQVPRVGEFVGCFGANYLPEVFSVVWLPSEEYLKTHLDNYTNMTRIDVFVWCK